MYVCKKPIIWSQVSDLQPESYQHTSQFGCVGERKVLIVWQCA